MPSTITFTLSTLKSSAIVFYNGQIPGNCTSIDPSKQMAFPQWQQSSYSRLSRKFHSEQALYNNCYGHEYNVKSNIRVQNLWKLAKSKSYPIMIWIWMLLLSYSMDKSISGSHNSAHASLIHCWMASAESSQAASSQQTSACMSLLQYHYHISVDLWVAWKLQTEETRFLLHG